MVYQEVERLVNLTDEDRAAITKIEWWHHVYLEPGLTTNGRSKNCKLLPSLNLPADLSGMTVLDIGAWDGFFSFECERRGGEVTALDSAEHSWGKFGTGKAGFDFAKKVLGSNCAEVVMEVCDISTDIGTYDLVLFLGVLYHLKHPLLALEKVFNIVKKKMILETFVVEYEFDRPILDFYHWDHKDKTCWWAPNEQCVTLMLESIGYRSIEVYETPWDHRKVFHAYK